MVEVLSEYFSDDMKKKATVRLISTELNCATKVEVSVRKMSMTLFTIVQN